MTEIADNASPAPAAASCRRPAGTWAGGAGGLSAPRRVLIWRAGRPSRLFSRRVCHATALARRSQLCRSCRPLPVSARAPRRARWGLRSGIRRAGYGPRPCGMGGIYAAFRAGDGPFCLWRGRGGRCRRVRVAARPEGGGGRGCSTGGAWNDANAGAGSGAGNRRRTPPSWCSRYRPQGAKSPRSWPVGSGLVTLSKPSGPTTMVSLPVAR